MIDDRAPRVVEDWVAYEEKQPEYENLVAPATRWYDHRPPSKLGYLVCALLLAGGIVWIFISAVVRVARWIWGGM